jgi:cytochrome c oxidase subunit I+III
MTVAIPTGVQIFAFIATLWSGRPWLRIPLLYVFGFFFVFVLGGLTGVMLAMVPFDWQAHDTHFVVAHMHYVLIGGMMFPLFAGLHYWLPLVSGRMPSETLSRTAFWLIFIGFNLTFLPMHLTGLLGLPRRVYTYNPQLGVEWLNLTSTAAGFLLAFGVVAALVDLGIAYRIGRRSERNPWNADSLEWALKWPVPMYNFASIPVVESRTPLWDRPELAGEGARMGGLLGGRDPEHRELLGTGILSARPEQVIRISSSTWLPLLAALCIAVLLAFFIAKVYLAAALMLVPLIGVFMRWLWTTGDRHAPPVLDAGQGLRLPSQSACRSAPGWWALVTSLLIDASLFASLVFSYFYLWLGAPQWPPSGASEAGLLWPVAALALLVAGEVAMRIAVVAVHGNQGARLRTFLLLAAFLAAGFLALHWVAISDHVAAPQTDAYSSVVWTLAGFHAVHVVVALLMAGFVWMRSRRGYVDAVRVLEPRIAAAFWRYMVVQGVIAWLVIHVFPRTL